MIFQILLIAFAVFAISRTIKQYRAARVSLHWTLVWGALWASVIGVAAYPRTADAVAALVGVGRGADLALYAAVVALSYATFRLFVRQTETERAITSLVRRMAVSDPAHPEPNP